VEPRTEYGAGKQVMDDAAEIKGHETCANDEQYPTNLLEYWTEQII
jgi:hypothetical protein